MALHDKAAFDRAAFATAFEDRISETADACVGCGKCFEACPITAPAGLADFNGEMITTGVRSLLSGGEWPDVSAKWAQACILSGDCIKVCDYGVNPRLMLSMARMKLSETDSEPKARRGNGVKAFAKLGRDIKVLSRIQLDDAQLARLGQSSAPAPNQDSHQNPTLNPGASNSSSESGTTASVPPDVVLYTGCNVLKTPHIALLSLDILDALDVSYRVLGGPSHCCGILQYRSGDMEVASRMGAATIDKFVATGAIEVLAWCPSCQVQFSEINLPNYAAATSLKPIDFTPYMLFLKARLEKLTTRFINPVPMRVALHAHPGVDGVPDAARALLRAVPGVELIELGVPEVGLMSNSLRPLPQYQRELQRKELQAAANHGVDALAAVYHADHRELCAHEGEQPFAIVNVLEIIAASMGLHQTDRYKQLKLKQDADAILDDCADLIAHHAVPEAAAREVVTTAMLSDQPLPLQGKA
ncbi:MAG: (Fe-S)-binding protein [Pseudomonadota bacterium]